MSDSRIDIGTSAHERVYRLLRTRILHGELSPGDALTLRGIAAEFDVSMTPAREAVRRLVAERALSLSPSGRVSLPVMANERVEELAAIRALMEPELGSRALARAHSALIERLYSINASVNQMVVKGDAVGYIRTNQEFHRTLYLRAQAPAMLAMTEMIWLQLGPTMRMLYQKVQRQAAKDNHSKIIAALRSGDEPGLRLAIRADVTEGLRMLLT